MATASNRNSESSESPAMASASGKKASKAGQVEGIEVNGAANGVEVTCRYKLEGEEAESVMAYENSRQKHVFTKLSQAKSFITEKLAKMFPSEG